jgi:hypothetical protein
VLFEDLVDYRRQSMDARQAALGELAKQAQKLGLGYRGMGRSSWTCPEQFNPTTDDTDFTDGFQNSSSRFGYEMPRHDAPNPRCSGLVK